MRGLIGKKIGMTQIYSESGSMIPVTVIEAGPCAVIQVKSIETDGYEAVQIGYGERKVKHSNNPLNGHFKKAGVQPKKYWGNLVLSPGLNINKARNSTFHCLKWEIMYMFLEHQRELVLQG